MYTHSMVMIKEFMSSVSANPPGNKFYPSDKYKEFCTPESSTDSICKDLASFPLNDGTTLDAKGKFWIEAYGCSSSMNDSEMISGMLKNDGYQISESPHDASVNIIVTCSVKDTTEHRMLHRIAKLSESGKPLIVAGCLPKADRVKVESINSSASMIGPETIERITEVVRSSVSGRKKVELENDKSSHKLNIPKIRLNPIVSIVQIASGCLSECSFCQTRLVKGSLRSYRLGDIVRQIKADLFQGCKEIWLSSTDNGCYGRDIGTNLASLLSRCCELDGDFKIRVGMMNPMYIPRLLNPLVDIFSQENKILKFLHMPVQSGSNRVLRKMRRGHSAQTFLKAVQIFRDRIPEITIATDIIVGYPSETEEDFQQTVDLLEMTKPDIVNISKYSARHGVLASCEKKVPSHITKNRSRRLDKIVSDISSLRNSQWVGWTGEIIVDEIAENFVQGRNYAYKPIILTSDYKKKLRDNLSLGSRVRVIVFGSSRYALRANLL
jgi:threonylcarbamoyladenosine tRNA methylthiotransferase CDKAL1